MGADEITPFLSVEFRRDARRVHQVAEHHRDVPALPRGFGRSSDRHRQSGRRGWRLLERSGAVLSGSTAVSGSRTAKLGDRREDYPPMSKEDPDVREVLIGQMG
jgi:hypothetical protein